MARCQPKKHGADRPVSISRPRWRRLDPSRPHAAEVAQWRGVSRRKTGRIAPSPFPTQDGDGSTRAALTPRKSRDGAVSAKEARGGSPRLHFPHKMETARPEPLSCRGSRAMARSQTKKDGADRPVSISRTRWRRLDPSRPHDAEVAQWRGVSRRSTGRIAPSPFPPARWRRLDPSRPSRCVYFASGSVSAPVILNV